MGNKKSARVKRLEQSMIVLAGKEAQLEAVLVRLAEEQRKTAEVFGKGWEGFHWSEERSGQTTQTWRETEEHRRELVDRDRERSRELDARVDRLAADIRELIRRRDGGEPTTPTESTL